MERRHFFERKELAKRVRAALCARGFVAGDIRPHTKVPRYHCCADDCCRQSPCRDAVSGFMFASTASQREVHAIALANGGRHVFAAGSKRCRYCGETRGA